MPYMGQPKLWRVVELPGAFCTAESVGSRSVNFGGDLRIGDLRNSGQVDFLVYRSARNTQEGGGMTPCFLGAFNLNGQPLWSCGEGGMQPARPGTVAVHDLDGDGCTEVITFFCKEEINAAVTSLADVVIQIRDGATGSLKKEAAPDRLQACHGHGPNWVHQRIIIANFRGLQSPQDFVVKLGAHVLAFDANLEILWEYESLWTEYGHCPAYIPAVGDIDGDGKDEVSGIGVSLPGLPPPEPVGRMAWYHCIPADVCGDAREEVVLYNPWTTRIFIYTQHDCDGTASTGFKAGPRQYNPRLMD